MSSLEHIVERLDIIIGAATKLRQDILDEKHSTQFKAEKAEYDGLTCVHGIKLTESCLDCPQGRAKA